MSEADEKDTRMEQEVCASEPPQMEPVRWPCAVVQDLMPLEIDGVASEESGEVVREHVEGCEGCRAAYARMKKDVIEVPKADVSQARSVMRGLWRKLSVRTAIVALVVALIVVYLGHGLLNNTYWMVPAEHVEFLEPVLTEGTRHLVCEVDEYINPYRTYAWLMADEEVENGLALHIRWETSTEAKLNSLLPWSKYHGVNAVQLIVLHTYSGQVENGFTDEYGREYGADAVLSAVYYDESPVGTSDPARAKLLWCAEEADYPLVTFGAMGELLKEEWARPH